MEALAVTVLILAVITSVMAINDEEVYLDDITAFGYLRKVGVPLATNLRKAEEEIDKHPNRIFGGEYSLIEYFPYQAGIIIATVFGDSICGGTLLNSRRVLTAAHCWFDGENQAFSFKVVLGSTRLFGHDGVRMDTTDVIQHPGYSPPVINDIAMIMLPQDVEFSDTIFPIALPSGNELENTFVGWYGMASGYGFRKDMESTTTEKFLSYVYLPLISFDQCYPFQSIDRSIFICASGAEGKSTCLGDSGGPLVVNNDDKIVLVGVCSFISTAGCEKGYPAMFDRVSAYMDWINELLEIPVEQETPDYYK